MGHVPLTELTVMDHLGELELSGLPVVRSKKKAMMTAGQAKSKKGPRIDCLTYSAARHRYHTAHCRLAQEASGSTALRWSGRPTEGSSASRPCLTARRISGFHTSTLVSPAKPSFHCVSFHCVFSLADW